MVTNPKLIAPFHNGLISLRSHQRVRIARALAVNRQLFAGNDALRPQGFAWQRASRPGDLFVHLPRAALFFFFSPALSNLMILPVGTVRRFGFSATRGFFPAAAGGRVARFVEPSGASRP